jgi:DUF2934 family protein
MIGKAWEKKSPVQTQPVSSSTGLSERIAQRAYELYKERGFVDGHDIDDWLKAEREILTGPV